MKILIFLTLLAFTCAAEFKLKTAKEWNKIRQTCDARYRIPPILAAKAQSEQYPPKEIVQLIVLCYLKQLDIWNDSEGFSVDHMMAGLKSVSNYILDYDETRLRQGIEECRGERGRFGTTLDWAYRDFTCLIDNDYLFAALQKSSFHEPEPEIKTIKYKL